MKYLLTIYDDESMWSDAQPGDVNADDGRLPQVRPRRSAATGAFVAGEALESISTATTVRVHRTASASSPTARSRRRRSSSAASTCSTARTSTRRSTWAAKIPGAQSGCVEVRPVRVFAVRLSARRSDRPPVPARVGAGGRDAHPRPRRLRPRRGGGAGGVGRGARALAARRRPAQPGRVDHDDRAQPRDRPAAARARAARRSARSSRARGARRRARTSPTASPTTACG